MKKEELEKALELVIEKNKIANEIIEMYIDNFDLDGAKSKRQEELLNRNSEILIELTKLGLAKEI